MDAAVALQRKKTIKFLCIVDFSLSKQGVFFVTLRHKTVMKKMSQSFFFAVSLKIGDFTNQFLDTALQCCPTILVRFSQLDAHFSCRFPEFGRGGGNFFEKKQNKSCCFQNVFNFLFARTFYNLEKNISKLADLLGHSSIETTRIYIMESGAEHERLLNKMHLLL